MRSPSSPAHLVPESLWHKVPSGLRRPSRLGGNSTSSRTTSPWRGRSPIVAGGTEKLIKQHVRLDDGTLVFPTRPRAPYRHGGPRWRSLGGDVPCTGLPSPCSRIPWRGAALKLRAGFTLNRRKSASWSAGGRNAVLQGRTRRIRPSPGGASWSYRQAEAQGFTQAKAGVSPSPACYHRPHKAHS